MTENLLKHELPLLTELARKAGAAALKFYGGPLRIEHKATMDEPVTQADHAANDLIVGALQREFPADGLLSEESIDTKARLAHKRVWIIDPLDGTNGFIDGNGDFAVQIGLATENIPVLGVVYLPATDVLYWAVSGEGAWVVRPEIDAPERLSVSTETDLRRMRLAASRSHRSPRMDRVVKTLGFREEVQRGSVGVKVGLIVEKQCDLYVHLSPRTKHWDTCAPEVILREAGGEFTDLFGGKIHYNAPDVRNHNGIVATNGISHATVLDQLQPLLKEFGRTPV